MPWTGKKQRSRQLGECQTTFPPLVMILELNQFEVCWHPWIPKLANSG